MKKIILTGGGTAGHVMPNLALIPDLQKVYKIYYLGEKNSIEEKLIKKYKNVTFVPIKSVKFIRSFNLKNFLIPFKMISYIKETKNILQDIKPDIIFSKGGYVSLPVVFAGSKLNIPILAHECDYSMGLANKLILKKCQIMFTSFRETCISNKCIYSGNPIRSEIFKGKKELVKNICNFKKNLPIIMFFGGSLGSKKINNFVFNNIDDLKDFNIIHIVGKNNKNKLKRDNYFQIDFVDNIYDYFDYADIVVCRAGANSIFELLALKKLMILIPLSKKQSRGDQIENAKIFKNNGFAKVIEEEKLTLYSLKKEINLCLKTKNLIKEKMNKYNPLNANKIIIDYIIKNS